MPNPPTDAYVDLLGKAVRALAAGDRHAAQAAADELTTTLPLGHGRTSISRPTIVCVLKRDRFSCRYCGTHTVPTPVLRAASLVWPEQILYKNDHWPTDATHPIYVARSASIDHVVPHAHGGLNNLDNLVTACWPCNAQKGEFTLERLGWSLLEPSRDDWDGLVRLYPTLWSEAAKRGTAADVIYHTGWLAAFGRDRLKH